MPATATEQKCWFEFYRMPMMEAFKAAAPKKPEPERIFSSKDPRWAEITADTKLRGLRGSLLTGQIELHNDRAIPDTVVTTNCRSLPFSKAQAIMAEWEKNARWRADGRLWDTPKADLVREEKEARAQGNLDLANALAAALSRDVKSIGGASK